jgi:hypothetical protein
MGRKLWTSPMLPFFKGSDSVPTSRSFQSLTEYLRGHVGYWQDITGTTDSNGFVNFAVDCGFDPSAVLVTEFFVSGSAHDMGGFHVHDYSKTNLNVHFLTKSGQDRTSHAVRVCYMMLPDTGER